MTPRYDCPCQRGGTDVTSLSLLHSPAERQATPGAGELIAKKMTLIIEVHMHHFFTYTQLYSSGASLY